MTDDKPARRAADKPELETDLRDALQEADRRWKADHAPDHAIEIVEQFELSYCEGNAVAAILNKRNSGLDLLRRRKDLELAVWYIQREMERL